MGSGWEGFDIGGDLTPDGRTWEEVIPEGERLGGPSEWGNSRWKDFLQCPFKYWAKHVRKVRATVEHPRYETLGYNLWVGGLYHEARARYYLENLKHVNAQGEKISGVLQPEVDEACAKAMFDLVDAAGEIQPTVATEARRLLMGWMSLYGPGSDKDDRDCTMYIEKLFSTKKGGFPYTCRLDRVLWSEDAGGPIIQEHKTASWYNESLLASYRTDPQILGQIYLWENSPLKKKHGSLVAFEVDIAVKTRQREYYRERVPIALDAVENWAQCMKLEWRALKKCQKSGFWPRRRTNCFMWAKPCELHEGCAGYGGNFNVDDWAGYSCEKELDAVT